MKTFEFDYYNVGGLLHVYAIPPASLRRIRKDYVGGLNYIELQQRDNVIEIPVLPDSSYSFSEDKEFDFDDGITIYELEFTAGGNEYEYDVHAVTGKILKAGHQAAGQAENDTDYGPDNDGVTDYSATDYGPDNDGATDYGNTDYGGQIPVMALCADG